MKDFIDIHAHLDDESFNEDRNDVLKRFFLDGGKIIITNGTNEKTSEYAVRIATENENVYATVGLHPEEIDQLNEYTFSNLEKLAKNEKVVAIGEIGLDYHFTKENKENQIHAFVEQLKLASKLALPVIIHNRDSIGDMLEILEKNKVLLKNGGVLHCFSESKEILERILNLGLYVSIGGILTFSNANRIRDLFRSIDKSRVLVETDSPYLSPVPVRGKRNEPKNVKFVVETLAKIWDISENETIKILEANTKSLFKNIKF